MPRWPATQTRLFSKLKIALDMQQGHFSGRAYICGPLYRFQVLVDHFGHEFVDSRLVSPPESFLRLAGVA